jgi:ADP-heptose:LPS heptosyltransferase
LAIGCSGGVPARPGAKQPACFDSFTQNVKPKLLVVELWGLGDLVIATPFLRAASEKFAVTLVAKPAWMDLQVRFWPGVTVVPFLAPWTAFKHKYRLHTWPWREVFRLRRQIGRGQFDVGLSARWDPRDHILLALAHAQQRLGFPRMGSGVFLNRTLDRPDPEAHRFENWRVLGQALGLELPSRDRISIPAVHPEREEILIHTGAGQPVRVWPLERYRALAARLREKKYRVQVACDPDQRDWWLKAGEQNLAMPRTVLELLALVDRAGVFIGNDSGPGHLAAMAGVPTFTIFGPQLPEWFAPLHLDSECIEGKPCPYKPCSDYCMFKAPFCIQNVTEEELWSEVSKFIARKHRWAARLSASTQSPIGHGTDSRESRRT